MLSAVTCVKFTVMGIKIRPVVLTVFLFLFLYSAVVRSWSFSHVLKITHFLVLGYLQRILFPALRAFTVRLRTELYLVFSLEPASLVLAYVSPAPCSYKSHCYLQLCFIMQWCSYSSGIPVSLWFTTSMHFLPLFSGQQGHLTWHLGGCLRSVILPTIRSSTRAACCTYAAHVFPRICTCFRIPGILRTLSLHLLSAASAFVRSTFVGMAFRLVVTEMTRVLLRTVRPSRLVLVFVFPSVGTVFHYFHSCP
jgi:hypothetical protein